MDIQRSDFDDVGLIDALKQKMHQAAMNLFNQMGYEKGDSIDIITF